MAGPVYGDPIVTLTVNTSLPTSSVTRTAQAGSLQKRAVTAKQFARSQQRLFASLA